MRIVLHKLSLLLKVFLAVIYFISCPPAIASSDYLETYCPLSLESEVTSNADTLLRIAEDGFSEYEATVKKIDCFTPAELVNIIYYHILVDRHALISSVLGRAF